MTTLKTFSFEWLSGCSGCEVAFADLHENLPTVLAEISLVRFPILMDIKEYPCADVGVITGSIRTEHDREAAHKMRNSCDIIVALGTCPVYGGPHAGYQINPDDMLRHAFYNNPTTITKNAPKNIPELLENRTLDTEIKVDAYLPGCPPHPRMIIEGLRTLIDPNFRPKFGQHNICFSCPRKMEETQISAIRRNFDGIPNPNLCFLSQGYICLGSVTIDRCLAPCPKAGIPCFSCSGPSLPVLLEPQKDMRVLVAERIAQLTNISVTAIIAELIRNEKTYNLFVNGSAMLRTKPTARIAPIIQENR